MAKLFPMRTKLVPVDDNINPIPGALIHRLTEFTKKHYQVENSRLVVETILKPGHAGELVVFYGEADEIAGYTRICRQRVQGAGKTIITYSASTYTNQIHDLTYTGARLGLTQVMKYKLAHPEEELVYFSSVSSPDKYRFLVELYQGCYPQPGMIMPESISEQVNDLKEYHGWASSLTHPMLISGQLKPLNPPKMMATEATDQLIDYYCSLNPDCEAGNALLVYIPLDLTNIKQGIRQLVTHTPDARLRVDQSLTECA